MVFPIPVISEIAKVATAPLIGGLFGLSYGTAIRIGYEQIYPALFPKNTAGKEVSKNLPDVLSQLEGFYNLVGGKAMHQFGLDQGLENAIKQFESSPIPEAYADSVKFETKQREDTNILLNSILASMGGAIGLAGLAGNANQPAPPPTTDSKFNTWYLTIQNMTTVQVNKFKAIIDSGKNPTVDYPFPDRYNDIARSALVTRKDIIIAELRDGKKFDTKITDNPFLEKEPEVNTALQTYRDAKSAIFVKMEQAKSLFNISYNPKMPATKPYGANQTNGIKLMKKFNKEMMTLITHARNNIVTKVEANGDNNKRLWKAVSIGKGTLV